MPINVTLIIGKFNNLVFPISVQLIKCSQDKFKYVGADFIYAQNFNKKINKQIKKYNEIIVNQLKEKGYKGILGIDYIIDNNDNLYFMKINPRFQSFSFLINIYLEKYCSSSLAEYHYLATNDLYIGSNYIDKIDNSFINCRNKKDYEQMMYFKILKKGYYSKNKESFFRKIFNYSILTSDKFEQRKKDK